MPGDVVIFCISSPEYRELIARGQLKSGNFLRQKEAQRESWCRSNLVIDY